MDVDMETNTLDVEMEVDVPSSPKRKASQGDVAASATKKQHLEIECVLPQDQVLCPAQLSLPTMATIEAPPTVALPQAAQPAGPLAAILIAEPSKLLPSSVQAPARQPHSAVTPRPVLEQLRDTPSDSCPPPKHLINPQGRHHAASSQQSGTVQSSYRKAVLEAQQQVAALPAAIEVVATKDPRVAETSQLDSVDVKLTQFEPSAKTVVTTRSSQLLKVLVLLQNTVHWAFAAWVVYCICTIGGKLPNVVQTLCDLAVISVAAVTASAVGRYVVSHATRTVKKRD
jgi:hypothetical protein